MKKIFSTLALAATLVLLSPVFAAAQAPKSAYTPQEYIDKVLKKDSNYLNAIAAIKLLTKTGRL